MKETATQVLVVDDDPIIRELHADMLMEAGYTVECADNGLDALEMLRTGAFRLVVSDWVMPVVSGLELCRAIRSRNYGRYIYVILVTARDATEDTVAALDAGADDLIVKPVKPAELCVRLRVGERMLSLENRDVTILALAKMAETRDNETGAHLERVREYSRMIATDLSHHGPYQNEIDGDYIEAIYATSPLHDIGKVGIPDEILLKSGKLTDDEFDKMKEHTIIGAETLSSTLQAHPEASFLRVASDIAISHHERWNGSGYPYGLSGEEIPLCGRIVALADVYDALVTKRVYKPAFTHEKTRSMIAEENGKHFDPAVVTAFFRRESQFAEVGTWFRDSASNSSIADLDQLPMPNHAEVCSNPASS
jgi:putative two-component system response regulator